MALRFDPNAYFRAHQMGEEARLANQRRPLEMIEGMGKIATGLAGHRNEKLKLKQNQEANQAKIIEDRKKEFLGMVDNLADKGLNPDEINAMYSNYVTKGDLSIPTERTTTSLAPLPAGVQGPQQQVTRTEPIRFGKRTDPNEEAKLQAEIALKEAQRNWYNRRPGESADSDLLSVDPDNPDAPPRNLGTFKKGSKVITLPRPTAQREDPETAAQRKHALDTINMVNRLIAAGEDVPEELMAQAQELAPLAGMNLIEEPTGQKTGFPGFRKEKMRQVFKPGQSSGQKKQLTPELAKDFLRRAGGDKNKARQLAEQAGYSL